MHNTVGLKVCAMLLPQRSKYQASIKSKQEAEIFEHSVVLWRGLRHGVLAFFIF